MEQVSLAGGALLLTAAFFAGVINTVVGSGSLLTFPALLALGIPPVPANIANNAGLSVGNLAGVWGYRAELVGQWRKLVPFMLLTAVGAAAGALALLNLPNEMFGVAAPALIVLGCALVVLQPLISRRAGRRTPALSLTAAAPSSPALSLQECAEQGAIERPLPPVRRALAYLSTLGTGIYGGYFGAAQGVIIVGLLGVLLDEPLQRINAIKNVLQTIAGATATVIFVTITHIDWGIVAVLAVGSTLGATVGAAVGRRIPPWFLRAFIVLVGAGSIYLLR